MRLNKYIAQAGCASRRKADEMTSAGRVKINGQVITTPGYDVQAGDLVEVDGRLLQQAQQAVYIALNKPKGYITTVSDEQGRPTVMDLATDIEARVFPVGRLDAATSGLLIMTNDGDLAYRMTHPKHGLEKTYRARVNGTLSKERIAALRRGVDIGGYTTAPAEVSIVRQTAGSAVVEIKIREGKNRQVRKMFAAVGNKVIELERIAIGDVRLGRLKSGHYRKLSASEVEVLRNA